MYVVSVDQSYANFFYVVGVFSTMELAEKCKRLGYDRIIDEFNVDEFPKD